MANARPTAGLAALALSAALALGAGPAQAQDVAAAEALFNEGRALLLQGDYAAACPKLAESQRIDPSSGTAINLALCHRKQGKTATAWAEYKLAARLARQQQKTERAEEAERAVAELEPDLSYLTIAVPSPVPGLEVRRGDLRLEAGSLGARLPVDPGKHSVRASAPGHKPWSAEVIVGEKRDAQRLTIPALEKEPSAPPPVATPSGGRGPAPWIVGGVGVAAAGVGAAFGILALKTYGQAKESCPDKTGCSADALDLRSRANLQANVANVLVPVGVATVGAGVLLYLLKGRGGEAKPAAIVPVFDRGFAGVAFAGVL